MKCATRKFVLMLSILSSALLLSAFLAPASGKNITTISGDFNLLNANINTVAVLQIDNSTKKKAASEWLRRALIEGFESYRFYNVLKEGTIDKKLQDAGITDIYSSSPQTIGKILGADALVYTRISAFKEKVNIAFASIETAARTQLVDMATGKVIYDSQQFNTNKGLTPGGIIFASLQAIKDLRDKLLKKYPLKKKVETYRRKR